MAAKLNWYPITGRGVKVKLTNLHADLLGGWSEFDGGDRWNDTKRRAEQHGETVFLETHAGKWHETENESEATHTHTHIYIHREGGRERERRA